MTELGVQHYVVLSAIVFCLGLFCVVTRRNALGILMGIELILNSANLNYVAFGRYGGGGGYDGPLAYRQGKPMRPDVARAFARLASAAREDAGRILRGSRGVGSDAAIGLAIVLGIYQTFETIDVDATDRLRG